MNCQDCAEYGSDFCKHCEDRLTEARKPQPPRWKRGKYPGEIEATIGGKKYKIEKALDHNDRHRGEWKVMVWDKRTNDWEWETTEYGKANAKEWIYNKHDIKEEAMTAADAGIPADTKDMGPRLPKHILRRRLGVPINMTDRRRKKEKVPVLLKRFRKYMDG
jgi:hypothetical protein